MLQRHQILWLLLATAGGILNFMFPFAGGEELVLKTAMKQRAEIIAGNNFFTLILTVVTIGISVVTIFMFKDRKMQMKLCLLGLLVSVLILVLYFLNMKKIISATPALWSILPVAVIAGYYMAFRNIRKDEKLVKSLDKLR